jgi:hypothetical protein
LIITNTLAVEIFKKDRAFDFISDHPPGKGFDKLQMAIIDEAKRI